MRKTVHLFALISSTMTFMLIIALATRAAQSLDANAFIFLAFLSLLVLTGVVTAWKRVPLLILFASLMLLPFGLYVLWFGEGIFRLIGVFDVLFVISGFVLLALEHKGYLE